MAQVTLADAARRLMVTETDIEDLSKEGLLTITTIDETPHVNLEDIKVLVKTMPQSLRDKMGSLSWSLGTGSLEDIAAEVNARFVKNLAPLLDRAERTVQLMQRVHSEHEPGIDIFADRRGSVAAFILIARIISLLYSALALLRSAVPAETMLLFRPIWEAGLLVRYFTASEKRKENAAEIRRWFEKEKSPQPSLVRDYISKHIGIPVEDLRASYNAYSKAVHLTYQAVMESYRTVSMSGFLGDRTKRLGFDYHKASMMRDIVSLYLVFEQLLLNALMNFKAPFVLVGPLKEVDLRALDAEIDFYSQDFQNRVNSEIGEHQQ